MYVVADYENLLRKHLVSIQQRKIRANTSKNARRGKNRDVNMYVGPDQTIPLVSTIAALGGLVVGFGGRIFASAKKFALKFLKVDRQHKNDVPPSSTSRD